MQSKTFLNRPNRCIGLEEKLSNSQRSEQLKVEPRDLSALEPNNIAEQSNGLSTVFVVVVAV